MENQVKFAMIPIEDLIDVLLELYEQGVNYVDILGAHHAEHDSIGLSFTKEYIDEDFQDNFEDDIPQIEINNKDDLNELI